MKCPLPQVDFSATDRIGEAAEAPAAAATAKQQAAPAVAKKQAPPAASAAAAAAAPAGAASPAAAGAMVETKKQQKQGQHAAAEAGEVHWRKKGWDWDADGRPCGELEFKKSWAETPMYKKPEGW